MRKRIIIGRLAMNARGFGFVIPDNKSDGEDIYIASNHLGGALNGDRVRVLILSRFDGNRKRSGRIIKVLERISAISKEIQSVIRKYDLPEEFSTRALTEAARIETSPSDKEIAQRIDRRQLRIVTIDGADAKDLDDGVYAERNEDGSYFLGVYIADVSNYVREGSPLDAEAYERGTSVYPVDRVIPMLPKELSNGICSLNAGMDRLAMACEMRLALSGRVEAYKIFPTVIKVYRRLTYEAVNKFFAGDRTELSELTEMLSTLKELRDKRFRLRAERGAIDFDLGEIKVILDGEGRPIDVIKRRRELAESVIEECMLTANETVARHLSEKNIPSLYRIHEPPAKDSLERLNELLNAFGFHLRIRANERVRPVDIQKILSAIRGRRGEQTINAATLRAMQQARYSSENVGHFGLAAKFYTHFTSPIRRYPDLVVHRLLKETIGNQTMSPARIERWSERLPEIASHTSMRERVAVEAERESTMLKAVEYMQQFVGAKFDGMICSVTKFGFFVELANGTDGLVRLSTLKGDEYNFVEREYTLVGRRTGRAFRIGDDVTVKLIEANVELRQLNFVLSNDSSSK